MRRRYDLARRAATLAVACAQLATLLGADAIRTAIPASASAVCATPGKDGTGTPTGIVNAYYPGGGSAVSIATGNTYPGTTYTAAAGSTSIAVGAASGAAVGITAGDLLLVIQMQDGSFTQSESTAYGSGGTSGSGYTSLGSAGLYEYVRAASAVGTGGGTVTIVGTGGGGGLINTYTEAPLGGSSGQKTFQVIRVPQYSTATLSSSFSAALWNGTTGGVAAIDVAGALALSSATISATGTGFRGGAVSVYASSATLPSPVTSDFSSNASLKANGSKGEGILGVPNFVYYNNAAQAYAAGTGEGYPGGSMAMGAPGDAGGGGTDANPSANDQNTGGGGGGNGGAGGQGGYNWSPTNTTSVLSTPSNGLYDIGGRGGAALPIAATRIFMGAGGGAGTNNNATNGPNGSSGGQGGGIVMLRILNTTGAGASLASNGTTGQAPVNDGGGGGGAGGSILVTSPVGFSGITATAVGAAGTNANATATGLSNDHGPGGGGGGGVVLSSSGLAPTLSGGTNGTTTTGADAFGATPGSSGVVQTVTSSQIPGVASGAECAVSSGTLLTGPVGASNTTGSFDGAVPTNNNNDFTAASFGPTSGSLTNAGTAPGTPSGNTLGAVTPFSVPNQFDYSGGALTGSTLTFTVTAPAGWTAQICSSAPSAGATTCPAASGLWSSIGAAGATSSSVYTLPSGTTSANAVVYYVLYSPPSGTVAFTRYDASIFGSDGGANGNTTHNELYAGFVPLTKSVSTLTAGNCASIAPAGKTCPGALMLYTIDYRNIMLGGASEASLPSALLATRAGTLQISESGGGANNWGTFSNGLNETLQASADGVTTFGDSIAGSTFAGNTVGSTSFVDTVGGSSFQLVAPGTAGTSQGTLTFRVKVK